MGKQLKKATFAGGCFWCMVQPFDEQAGIEAVISGYTGGTVPNPTYEQVCTNETGHYEAVEITYDENLISYDQLLHIFWRQIDPTDPGGQFHDRGESYKTAIFYHDDEQKQAAEKSKIELAKSERFSKPIVTEIIRAKPFYHAEEGHQDYYQKQPFHYKSYRKGSGREDFIKTTWKNPKDKEQLKQQLTQMQYHVTQEDGTEPPFQNEYWDNVEEGIYVDIVSGEVLFSSRDQFDAQCGWPSFTKPVINDQINEKIDTNHGMIRTEVRSKEADSHLGHVFPDGPVEHGGLRYCINSAATRFIKVEDMEEEGYKQYLYLFN